MEEFVVKLIRTEEGLRSLATNWIRLYRGSQPENPFLSYEWSIHYWQYLCPPSTPFLLTAWCDDVLVGLLPLRMEVTGGFRLLRFLADGRSDYLGPLIAPNRESVRKVLIERLFELAHEWDCCFLRKMQDIRDISELAGVGGAFRAIPLRSGVAPYLSFQGDWDELCAAGPSQLRAAQRKLRKFQREGGSIELFSGQECARLVEQIALIESNSWKEGTDTLRFQAVHEQEMLLEVLKTLWPHGEIEVWLAKFQSESCAFLINFLTPERTCFYQTAYNEQYQRFSPGTVLCFLAMQRTWREGRREFDFMDGREPFKKRWTNKTRELKKLVVFPKTIRGHLGFLMLIVSRLYQKYR